MVALSMEEQRMLDLMERKLADTDPRLAARLRAFGQPGTARMPPVLRSRRARFLLVVISMALAAIAAVMVYSIRSAPASPARGVTHSRTRVTPPGMTGAGMTGASSSGASTSAGHASGAKASG